MPTATKPITLRYHRVESSNESRQPQEDFAFYTGCIFGQLFESWKMPSYMQGLYKIEMPKDEVWLSFLLTEYLEGTVGQYVANIQFKDIWQKQLASKTVVDEIIDVGWLSHYVSSIFPKLEHILGVMEPYQILELVVVKEFKAVDEVLSIYSDEYRDEIRFTTMTSNETYDDELMSHLLEIERSIRLVFRNSPLCFEYIPALCDSFEEVLPRHARLIYRRGESAITTGSFMASST